MGSPRLAPLSSPMRSLQRHRLLSTRPRILDPLPFYLVPFIGHLMDTQTWKGLRVMTAALRRSLVTVRHQEEIKPLQVWPAEKRNRIISLQRTLVPVKAIRKEMERQLAALRFASTAGALKRSRLRKVLLNHFHIMQVLYIKTDKGIYTVS